MELRQGVELRADGRTLVGAAIRYGDVSPSHRERFEPGAFNVSPHLAPTLGHRTGRVLAYGQDVQVEDRDDALIVSAHLPRTATADLALAGVRNGRYRGWSVEFQARRETRDAEGIRVVQSADLPGLALVDHPSYPGSGVEARRRTSYSTYIARASIMDCKCLGSLGRESVGEIEFGADAFAGMVEQVTAGKRNVSAIARGADAVVADTATGSLKLTNGPAGLGIAISALDTPAGRGFREMAEAGVEVYARPVLNRDASEFEFVGDLVKVKRADFDFILVKPTPTNRGLEPLTPEGREGRAAVPALDDEAIVRALLGLEPPSPVQTILEPSRRVRLWL